MIGVKSGLLGIVLAGFSALSLILGLGLGAQQEADPAPAPTRVLDNAARALLLGSHLFSCQWVSWEDFGRAEVTDENGTLRLTASQSQGEDYAQVEGIITEVQAKTFTFQGRIVTRVSHINSGQPCRREGTFTFRISGQRRYWRLKEMDNPCENVVDYIDIFFKRPDTNRP